MNVGVTGCFLSGKTSFSKALSEFLDYEYFSSDEYVGELYKNNDISKIIIDNFGENIYIGGNIQKHVLSEIVFNSENYLRKLESIIHPFVKAEIKKLVKDSLTGRIFEVPLLYEKNLNEFMDVSILLRCRETDCLSRAKLRGFSEKDYMKRKTFFMQDSEKLKFNPLVVENNGDINALYKKAEEVSNFIRAQKK